MPKADIVEDGSEGICGRCCELVFAVDRRWALLLVGLEVEDMVDFVDDIFCVRVRERGLKLNFFDCSERSSLVSL